MVDAPCGEPYIFLPNAFTPNADGRNDILYLRGINVAEMWLIIYNRWGEKVFETREQSRGWDGTFRNALAPNAVYTWFAEIQDKRGVWEVIKGDVTLYRE